MILRIVMAVVLGGGIGLLVGLVGSSLNGQCPILCNPYVSTGFGVVVGLLIASGTASQRGVFGSPRVLLLDDYQAYKDATGATRGTVVVSYYTTSCPACRRQARVLGRLADRFAGRVTVAAVNVGRVREVAREVGLTAVPVTAVYRDGQRIRTLTGLVGEEALLEILEQHLAAAGGPAA
jgi:thioredoxin 1